MFTTKIQLTTTYLLYRIECYNKSQFKVYVVANPKLILGFVVVLTRAEP